MTNAEPNDPQEAAEAEQALSDQALDHVSGGKLPGDPPPRK